MNNIFILTIYRNGSLTAAPHTTVSGAQRAFAEYMQDDLVESAWALTVHNVEHLYEDGHWEKIFEIGSEIIASEGDGAQVDIIESPIFED
jgi:hypothetical protein